MQRFRNCVLLAERLLRARDEVFDQIREEAGVGRLLKETAVLFLLLACLYGLSMGCYRWVHPQFLFSDFIINNDNATIHGQVSWLDPRKGLVYTEAELPGEQAIEKAAIRFNISDPTAPYTIEQISTKGPYHEIKLSGGDFVLPGAWKYGLLSMLKVPILFLGTLLVCLPALYIVNVIFGLNMRFQPTVALFACALAAIAVLLTAFVPIVLFFSLFTSDYHFMKLLNSAAFGCAGLYGLHYLYRGALAINPSNMGRAKALLMAWLVIYAFVGTEMAWLLRPFIGTPYLPEFAALRPVESNFYVSLFGSLGQLFR